MDSLFYELLESVFMKFSPKKSVYARTLTSLTALAMFVALTGCSNTDDAAPDLQETTDASDSDPTEYIPASEQGPAANPPEPRLSSSATENSDEGAKAALEFFWEAEQHARLSGETRPLETVSTDECEFCNDSIEGWPESFSKGIWSVTDEELKADVTDVRVSSVEDEGPVLGHVYFQLHEPATRFYDSQGLRIEESFEEPEVKDWFALLLFDATAQQWKVDWVGLEESITWAD